jgi:hypothetical protein
MKTACLQAVFSLGRWLPIISHPKCLALQARHDRRNFERGFLVRL